MKIILLLFIMFCITSCSETTGDFSVISENTDVITEKITVKETENDTNAYKEVQATSELIEPQQPPTFAPVSSLFFEDMNTLYQKLNQGFTEEEVSLANGVDINSEEFSMNLYELTGLTDDFFVHEIEMSVQQYYLVTYYSDNGTKLVFRKVDEEYAENYWDAFGNNFESLSNNERISNIRLTETETEYGVMEEVFYDTNSGTDFYNRCLSFEENGIRYIWNVWVNAVDGGITGRWIVFNDELTYIIKYNDEDIPLEFLMQLDITPYIPTGEGNLDEELN